MGAKVVMAPISWAIQGRQKPIECNVMGGQLFRHAANMAFAINSSEAMKNWWRGCARSGLLAISLFACFACAFAAQPPRTEIILKNIPIRGAVHELADWGGYSMVLSSELENTPVSYSGKNIDPMMLAHDLVIERGLKWSRVAGINVFASECRLGLPQPQVRLASDKISLAYQDATLFMVLGSMAEYLGLGLSGADLPGRDVSVRIRTLPIKDAVAAISVAEAISVEAFQSKLLVSALPEASNCHRAQVASTSAMPPNRFDTENCPRKLAMPTSKEACSPLEYIETDRLKMRGLLTLDSDRGLSAWALVVTDNGYVYRVKRGQRLGTNMGIVTEIDRRGISLMETIKNADGYWAEQARLIAFE